MLQRPTTRPAVLRSQSRLVVRRSAVVVATLAATLAARLPAQQPAAAGERSVFLILVGRDTFAIERVRRTPTQLVDDMWFVGQRVRVRSTLTLTDDARVARAVVESWRPGARPDTVADGRLTATFAGDSLIQVPEGSAGATTLRGAVAAGALPWVNPAFALVEQVARRARALGGDRVMVPLQQLGGGPAVTATVTRAGADSVVVDFGGGVAFRLAVDAGGRVTGGRVPSQSMVIARLDSFPERLARAADPPTDYSAPRGAPYVAEQVTVRTPAGHVLTGTLTLPKGASRRQPVGAVVTVSGSGPQDRDSYIGLPGYRPFRQLADSLGRRGIAVLRMDDRGTGASTGTFKGATSADFAEDVRAGLAYLRTRPEINAKRLAVLGHSEGAVITPMVADKEPSLRAIVLLAGVAQPARSALQYQMTNMIQHDTSLTAARRDSAIAAVPARIDTMMAHDPWMRFFLRYDPSATARRVKTPVLILTGANDHQAAPSQVAEQEAAFRAAGNKDVTAKVVPSVNHLFVVDPDGYPPNYAKLPAPVRIQPEVVGTIVDWLVARLK